MSIIDDIFEYSEPSYSNSFNNKNIIKQYSKELIKEIKIIQLDDFDYIIRNDILSAMYFHIFTLVMLTPEATLEQKDEILYTVIGDLHRIGYFTDKDMGYFKIVGTLIIDIKELHEKEINIKKIIKGDTDESETNWK